MRDFDGEKCISSSQGEISETVNEILEKPNERKSRKKITMRHGVTKLIDEIFVDF